VAKEIFENNSQDFPKIEISITRNKMSKF
jgi:hypothetical protein